MQRSLATGFSIDQKGGMLRLLKGVCALGVLSFFFGGSLLVSAEPARRLVDYGLTVDGERMRAEVHSEIFSVASPTTRVLMIIEAAQAGKESKGRDQSWKERLRLHLPVWEKQFPSITFSLMSLASGVESNSHVFPPRGRAYDDVGSREANYVWKAIGMLAPDVVVVLDNSDTAAWEIPSDATEQATLFRDWPGSRVARVNSLAWALSAGRVAGVGRIPALRVQFREDSDLLPLWRQLERSPVRSEARLELAQREQRTQLEVAQMLARVYGQRFDEVSYIPALALIGRMRVDELTGDFEHREPVRKLVAPYMSGEKPTLPHKSNGSQQSGHLVFGVLADREPDPRWTERVRAAADLGFDHQGNPLPAMPAHSEMSDAVFMGTPLLALSARLTGEAKYREMALRHVRFMVALNERPDGLHQHSPVAPDRTAWGRGNGFVALGLALTLSELPPEKPEFAEVLTLYRKHLMAMAPHQDSQGMWHQVVDEPGSYAEFSVTCMMAIAMTRGLRSGWIDSAEYAPRINRASRAVNRRISNDGSLVDVCTGTGKMKSRQEYLDRPAIQGRDERGGAMALLLAVELAFAEREGRLKIQ